MGRPPRRHLGTAAPASLPPLWPVQVAPPPPRLPGGSLPRRAASGLLSPCLSHSSSPKCAHGEVQDSWGARMTATGGLPMGTHRARASGRQSRPSLLESSRTGNRGPAQEGWPRGLSGRPLCLSPPGAQRSGREELPASTTAHLPPPTPQAAQAGGVPGMTTRAPLPALPPRAPNTHKHHPLPSQGSAPPPPEHQRQDFLLQEALRGRHSLAPVTLGTALGGTD